MWHNYAEFASMQPTCCWQLPPGTGRATQTHPIHNSVTALACRLATTPHITFLSSSWKAWQTTSASKRLRMPSRRATAAWAGGCSGRTRTFQLRTSHFRRSKAPDAAFFRARCYLPRKTPWRTPPCSRTPCLMASPFPTAPFLPWTPASALPPAISEWTASPGR